MEKEVARESERLRERESERAKERERPRESERERPRERGREELCRCCESFIAERNAWNSLH